MSRRSSLPLRYCTSAGPRKCVPQPISDAAQEFVPVDNAVDNLPKSARFTDFLWISSIRQALEGRTRSAASTEIAGCALFQMFSTGFSTDDRSAVSTSARFSPAETVIGLLARAHRRHWSPAERRRTANYPAGRTIVREFGNVPIEAIPSFSLVPVGQDRSLDCPNRHSIM